MSDVHKTIEAVWKIESIRLIAAIARVTRDVGLAEELAQDALVTALEVWPEEGIPDNPGAWLMTAARRRAIDSLRRGRMLVLKHSEIARELEWQQQRLGDALEQSLDQVIDDDVLRLIFTACHPVLPVEGRIALTLRLIGGLSTAEIARAFLVQEKTLGQRISRAKKTLSEAHVPFETPTGDELRSRVESVLMVVYLIFNEGYTATSGDEWMRTALSEEALRLGRMLGQLLPGESEVHALVALMELQSSRNSARRGTNGEAVLLPDQDRSLWDCSQIHRGMAALEHAQRLGGGAKPYALQAAIAGAVAIGMALGPAAGLDSLDATVVHADDSALAGYHLFHSVRADLLEKMGRLPEARDETRRAIAMTKNLREKELLKNRLTQLEKALLSE